MAIAIVKSIGSRALGGTKQDITIEARMVVLMDLSYYLEFMRLKLSSVTKARIFLKNLFIVLQSVEMISMLCLISIVHVAIILP